MNGTWNPVRYITTLRIDTKAQLQLKSFSKTNTWFHIVSTAHKHLLFLLLLFFKAESFSGKTEPWNKKGICILHLSSDLRKKNLRRVTPPYAVADPSTGARLIIVCENFIFAMEAGVISMQQKSHFVGYNSSYTIKQAVICQNCFLEWDTCSLQKLIVTDASVEWVNNWNLTRECLFLPIY